MSACKTVALNSMSDAWLSLAGFVCGRKKEDELKRATMLLAASIEATAQTEHEITGELRHIATKVRSMRSTHIKKDLNAMLKQSKQKRARLEQTTKKRLALESHMETLNSSQLNQQVMSSVRQTSDVLKSMGLEKELDGVDEVMMDLSESRSDMNSIQDGLSQSVGLDTLTEEDLEQEMHMLLEDGDSPSPMSLPRETNTMKDSVADTHESPYLVLPASAPAKQAASQPTEASREHVECVSVADV